jgi:hypothetical protein
MKTVIEELEVCCRLKSTGESFPEAGSSRLQRNVAND